MCGRYLFYDDKNEKIRRLIALAEAVLDPVTFSSLALHEVFPKNHALISVYDEKRDKYHAEVMQWGWHYTGRMVINARSETFLTSRYFRDAKPCAVLCCGYYEWSEDHRKYYFSRAGEALYLAGLYHREQDADVYTILTEEATGRQAEIHHRQPLVLSYEKAQAWCHDIRVPVHAYSLQERSCTLSE